MENSYTFSYVPNIRELIQLQKASKYSTTELANKLKMNRSELSQILNGKRGINHDKFIKIYNFLYKQKTKNDKIDSFQISRYCSLHLISIYLYFN